MGRANIYIRKEHEERWNNLKDKSDWVNAMLKLHDDFKVPKDPLETSPSYGLKVPPAPRKSAGAPLKPVIFKKSDGTTVVSGHDIESVANTVKSIAPDVRFSNGVCKIHGSPLDTRGRCLTKGCKYA